MGRAADKVMLQSRVLNMGKGAAVHSKRIQADRSKYKSVMKSTLENTPNLNLIQAEITDIRCETADGQKRVASVITSLGARWDCKAAIICSGTYLRGKIIVGEVSYASGPDGMLPANELTANLEREGIVMMRFKTGTPARVKRSSNDFTDLEVQKGDEPTVPFSYDTLTPPENKVDCHVSWTNENTKKIILDNIHRSPLYGGKIEGVGPRYCPSLEDKIVRFSDKKRHQLFIEPCGEDTEEMYLQGMSSSLPEEVQIMVAEGLDIPLSEVYGVATFYSLFALNTKGKYRISYKDRRGKTQVVEYTLK
jgi:tRNA uridine 5-carboxymethylaminomethyl modification enzyme